jgi:hypothetical protein
MEVAKDQLDKLVRNFIEYGFGDLWSHDRRYVASISAKALKIESSTKPPERRSVLTLTRFDADAATWDICMAMKDTHSWL